MSCLSCISMLTINMCAVFIPTVLSESKYLALKVPYEPLQWGEFYWRDIWKDGGWMKVWSKSLERIKNWPSLQQWNTSQRMQVVWKFFLQLLERPPLNTWSPEVKYILKSSILRWNYFFQYEGQGPPARGVESIWSAIKCQKRPICWYFYNITEWPQECHCCKCWGGLPNAPCWRTVEKKHYVHQNIHQISSPTTSPLIDFFIMLYKLYIGLGDVAIDGLPL